MLPNMLLNKEYCLFQFIVIEKWYLRKMLDIQIIFVGDAIPVKKLPLLDKASSKVIEFQ